MGIVPDSEGYEKELADHLMYLFWNGALSSPAGEALLDRFFKLAAPAVRAHALWFIGRLLCDAREVAPEILQRVRGLWEKRLAACESARVEFRDELAQFGWWFSSGKLADDWTLAQLETVVARVHHIEPVHEVVRRLAELSPSALDKSVRHLASIIEMYPQRWSVVGWEREARKVLSDALVSESAEVRSAAVALVHKLGAQGRREFRDLLSAAAENDSSL